MKTSCRTISAVAVVSLVILFGANAHSQESTPLGNFGEWSASRYVDDMDPNANRVTAITAADGASLMVSCGGKKRLYLMLVVQGAYLGVEPTAPLLKIDEHEALQFFGAWDDTFRPSEWHRVEYPLTRSFEPGQLH